MGNSPTPLSGSGLVVDCYLTAGFKDTIGMAECIMLFIRGKFGKDKGRHDEVEVLVAERETTTRRRTVTPQNSRDCPGRLNPNEFLIEGGSKTIYIYCSVVGVQYQDILIFVITSERFL